MSKITLLHPFMGKTVRIIRNPTAHCKQGGNKNENENMVRTNLTSANCAPPDFQRQSAQAFPLARIKTPPKRAVNSDVGHGAKAFADGGAKASGLPHTAKIPSSMPENPLSQRCKLHPPTV
jgi:hypothetical protein